MKSFWLVKQEPSSYSWSDFIGEDHTSWTGVRNYAARNNLRKMQKGDEVLFYHSGDDKAVVGIAKVPDGFSRRFAVSPFRRFGHDNHWLVERLGNREESILQISFSIWSALREPSINTTRFDSRLASSRYASRTRS